MAYLGRIAAEEKGRHSHRIRLDDRVVERDMMALEAPTPRALISRGPEKGGELKVGIADEAAVQAFDLIEHLFQANDLLDLDEGRIA